MWQTFNNKGQRHNSHCASYLAINYLLCNKNLRVIQAPGSGPVLVLLTNNICIFQQLLRHRKCRCTWREENTARRGRMSTPQFFHGHTSDRSSWLASHYQRTPHLVCSVGFGYSMEGAGYMRCCLSTTQKTQSFLIFDQQHRSMKCSIISNHICQCNLFSTILQQS